MKYKLMAVDMDGTLLNSKGELTRNNIKAIKNAVEKGLIFTISTGRPIQGVEGFNDILGIDLPFITYNGSMVVMGKSKEILYEKCLDAEDAIKIYELGKQYDATVIVWAKNQLFVSRMDERVKSYCSMSKVVPILVEDIQSIVKDGASKVLWYDEIENINRFEAMVGSIVGENVNFHTSKPIFLEFVHREASKGIALQKIAEHYGIEREQIIAIGDGANDLSMIEYAGLGVAMGNANAYIKDKAKFITRSCDEDGVAYVLERFIL